MWRKKKKLIRRRGGRRRKVGLRNMSVMPSLQTGPKVLEILVLGSNHPTELIIPLLNKVTECSMLGLNISSEECLLFLD